MFFRWRFCSEFFVLYKNSNTFTPAQEQNDRLAFLFSFRLDVRKQGFIRIKSATSGQATNFSYQIIKI